MRRGIQMRDYEKGKTPVELLRQIDSWESFPHNKEQEALFHALKTLLNAAVASKKARFGNSAHLLFWPQLKLFFEVYNNYRCFEFEKEDYEDIFKYIVRIFLAISSVNNSNHQFFQNPNLDPYIFDLPLKVSLFYAAFIDKAKTVLLQLEGDNGDKNARYEFLLSPELFQQIEVEECFKKLSIRTPRNNYATEKLLFIRAAEHELYRQEFLFPLMHEIAHFVGSSIRSRDLRYSVLKKFIAKQIIESIWRTIPKSVKEVDEDKCSKAIKAMLKSLEEKVDCYDQDGAAEEYGKYGTNLKEKFTEYVCSIIKTNFEKIVEPLSPIIWEWLKKRPEAELVQLYKQSEMYQKSLNKDDVYKVEAANAIMASIRDDFGRIQAKLTGTQFENKIDTDLVDSGIYLKNASVPVIQKCVDDFIYLSGEIYADLIAIYSLDIDIESYFSELQKQGDLFKALPFARIQTVVRILRIKNAEKLMTQPHLAKIKIDNNGAISTSEIQDAIAKAMSISIDLATNHPHENSNKESEDVWYLKATPLLAALLEYAETCYDAYMECLKNTPVAEYESLKSLYSKFTKDSPNIVDAIIEQEHLLRTYIEKHDWEA